MPFPLQKQIKHQQTKQICLSAAGHSSKPITDHTYNLKYLRNWAAVRSSTGKSMPRFLDVICSPVVRTKRC